MNRKLIFKLFGFLKPFWKHYSIVLGYIFVVQVIGLAQPYLIAKTIDAPTFTIAAFYIFLAFGTWFLAYVILTTKRYKYELSYLDFDTNIFLTKNSFAKLFGLSVGQHRNQHSGVKLHIINEGHRSINRFVNDLVFMFLPTVIQILITLVTIWLISPIIGLWISASVPVYVYYSLRRNKIYQPKVEEIDEKAKEFERVTSEVYRNIPLVILDAQEKKTNEEVYAAQMEVADAAKSTWFPWLSEGIMLRAMVGFIRYSSIAIAAYFVYQGSYEKGMLFALYSWIQQSVGNVELLISQQRNFLNMTSKIKKYLELLEMESDVVIAKDQINPGQMFGKIELRNVSYSYSGPEKNSVNCLNLTISPREKIGIVGESGSGKSTFANLLLRSFDPTEGEVLIDDIPLKNLDLKWYREQVGCVEQDVSLFDQSIRYNILFSLNGRAKYVTDEQMQHLAQMACIDEKINSLPEGFDTKIGEKGIKLSGGERQRVAIARALAKDPKIMIFDEATSSLDSFTEKSVVDAMERAAAGRTTIIIAHRLSTVLRADRIVVMKKGVIDDIGTHRELLQRCTEYQKLVENQLLTV